MVRCLSFLHPSPTQWTSFPQFMVLMSSYIHIPSGTTESFIHEQDYFLGQPLTLKSLLPANQIMRSVSTHKWFYGSHFSEKQVIQFTQMGQLEGWAFLHAFSPCSCNANFPKTIAGQNKVKGPSKYFCVGHQGSRAFPLTESTQLSQPLGGDEGEGAHV